MEISRICTQVKTTSERVDVEGSSYWYFYEPFEIVRTNDLIIGMRSIKKNLLLMCNCESIWIEFLAAFISLEFNSRRCSSINAILERRIGFRCLMFDQSVPHSTRWRSWKNVPMLLLMTEMGLFLFQVERNSSWYWATETTRKIYFKIFSFPSGANKCWSVSIGRYYQSPADHDAYVRRDKRHVYQRDRCHVCPLNTTHVLLLRGLHLRQRERERGNSTGSLIFFRIPLSNKSSSEAIASRLPTQ